MLSSLSSTIRTVLTIQVPLQRDAPQPPHCSTERRAAQPRARFNAVSFNLDKNRYGKANVNAMPRPSSIPREAAELLAVQALTFLAEQPERLDRFLALAGIDPAIIRVAAGEPGFLAGVLDHIASDEALLLEFATHAGIDPGAIDKAR